MAEQTLPQSIIINSLGAGELSPAMFGRTDLAKFHQGAATMRNFFVDYKGGSSSRPGTQFIGVPGSSGRCRLIPFKFSAAIGQTYMLVFSNLKLRFIKNPGTAAYPNSSNSGFILSAGIPYEIATPYLEADLPHLKFSQVADQMTITRHGYARRRLTRVADTNWTLTTISSTPPIGAPTISSITSTAPIAPDPGNTRYMFAVTAVDADGNESLPSTPFVSGAALNLALSQGTVTVFWGPVAGAVFYRVYKALPTPGARVPSLAQQLGFAGYTYGTYFNDNNVVPDFTRAPPSMADPFANSAIIGYTIAASSADWPVGGTTITVTDGTGTGAIIYPILSSDVAGATGSIVGLYIVEGGQTYTAPTLTAVGAGGTVFTATAVLSAASGNDPDVVALFQQRQIYASSINFPNTIWGSHLGEFTDFRRSNPPIDSDAYTLSIASAEVNDIVWLLPMPGGLVVATNSGISQITGGSSSASNPQAVTGANAVSVPQSGYGAADLHPILIDYDILFVSSEGSLIYDLQYNFFVNIYTGTDVTILSSHLFYPLTVVDWAWQQTPNKVIWAIRSDGALLSLTWLKSQEVMGWARHDTFGSFEAVATVREGSTDAVYMVINIGGIRHVVRLCDKIYNQIDDCWCLDTALSIASAYPTASIELSAFIGVVTLETNAAILTLGDVGKVVRALGGKAIVTSFTDTTHVQITVDPDYPFTRLSFAQDSWRMDPVVSSISGLAHLNGLEVYALVDGVVQGPFTVAAGSVTLTTPGSQVVVGLRYQCQLQPVYLDIGGEKTLQGQLKRNVAVTVRVKDSARVKIGPNFNEVNEWLPGQSSTDPQELIYTPAPGMDQGDIREYIAPLFDRVGAVAIQQDNPLPVTVLCMIPEVVL